MGHGKNKQKQSGGFGKEPKETREQRRRRIAEEAKAREVRWFVVNVVARYLVRLEGARAREAGGGRGVVCGIATVHILRARRETGCVFSLDD